MKGPAKVPCRLMNMHRQSPSFEDISLAEIGSIELEFKELARQSGNVTYKVDITVNHGSVTANGERAHTVVGLIQRRASWVCRSRVCRVSHA